MGYTITELEAQLEVAKTALAKEIRINNKRKTKLNHWLSVCTNKVEFLTRCITRRKELNKLEGLSDEENN